MRIEIDVFSGRPNPMFQLAPPQSDELRRLLSRLPPANNRPELGLGYRGFVIYFDPGEMGQLKSPLRAYSGFIIVESGMYPKVYRDANSCEQWLKEKARDAGYADLIR